MRTLSSSGVGAGATEFTEGLLIRLGSRMICRTLDLNRISIYDIKVIRSFRDADSRKIFNQEFSKRFQKIAKVALRKLIHVDLATTLDDLRALPGNRLESLEGDRRGQYSIRINDQYRVCFTWTEPDAYEVEIVDYH